MIYNHNNYPLYTALYGELTDPNTGIKGFVNRDREHEEPDSHIFCILECGYTADFWLQNKPDLYYLQTTIYFKQNNL